MHAFLERFSARCFDSIQPIRQNRAENIHHLPIAIGCSPQLALDPPHGRWQLPLLEGGTIPQGTGLPCEHGDVVQRVVDIFAASEDARMLTHELSILPELDAFSISADLDGTADGMSLDRVAVVVEPDEAGSSRSRPAPHGIRRRGQHRAQGLGAQPRRRPRSIGSRSSGCGWDLAQAKQRSRSQAFSSARLLKRGRGTKKRRRTTPTWFSTWPFSHPDAGVQATGSTR